MKIKFTLLTAFIFASFTLAQIPKTISYQGMLTDNTGSFVEDGNYEVTFRFYDDPAGGNLLWTEEQSVQLTNGIFNVFLGNVTPLTLSFEEQYFLTIQVDEEDELLPRIPLNCVPYSFIAANVEDNAITSAKIADNTITGDDIAANAIDYSKVQGMPGLKIKQIGAATDIPTMITNLGGVSITAPTDGYLVCIVSGSALFFGESTRMSVGLSTSPGSFNLAKNDVGYLDGTSTERFKQTFNCMWAGSVNAGPHNIYANVQKNDGFAQNAISIDPSTLVVMFFPAEY